MPSIPAVLLQILKLPRYSSVAGARAVSVLSIARRPLSPSRLVIPQAVPEVKAEPKHVNLSQLTIKPVQAAFADQPKAPSLAFDPFKQAVKEECTPAFKFVASNMRPEAYQRDFHNVINFPGHMRLLRALRLEKPTAARVPQGNGKKLQDPEQHYPS